MDRSQCRSAARGATRPAASVEPFARTSDERLPSERRLRDTPASVVPGGHEGGGDATKPADRSRFEGRALSSRNSRFGAAGVLTLSTLLGLSGCYTMPYYGRPYYGYNGYPSGPMYSTPPGTYVAPGAGGTYIPQPGGSPTGPTLLSPTPVNPSPSPTPNWRPQPGTSGGNSGFGDAPPFQSNPSAPNNSRPVPDPREPEFGAPPAAMLPADSSRPAPLPTFLPNDGAAATIGSSNLASAGTTGLPLNGNSVPALAGNSASAPGGLTAVPMAIPTPAAASSAVIPAAATTATVTASATTPDDPFLEPARLPATASIATSAAKPDPYAYDGEKYQWLRGVVDYDDLTQTWSIIYSLTPSAADPYGGSFLFAPHPDLATLHIGDVVLVEGRIDPARRDRAGKPLYEVNKVIPLAPQ